MTSSPSVETFGGAVPVADLGPTLIHEHLFVGDPELDLNFPHPEWDEEVGFARAVAGLARLHDLGVRTVVDLTVPGLGRDVRRVARIAEASDVRVVASTGWYTPDVLPAYFRTHGPDRLVGGQEPLVEYFLRDVTEGIAGTRVRAGMLKVVTDLPGLTPDVRRVMAAAAEVHRHTGVPITTHSHAPSRNGPDQVDFLTDHGVAPERIVIGHCGDTEDLGYLRRLLETGVTLGMDRFGMEHLLPDERRVATVVALLQEGYAGQLVLSQDAAFFSRVTPPSWRAAHAPHWHHENLHTRVLPMLRAAGVAEDLLDRVLVANPARLLTRSTGGAG